MNWLSPGIGMSLPEALLAVGLWSVLGIITFVEDPFNRVVGHPIWPTLAITGNWAPQKWQKAARIRLILRTKDTDSAFHFFLFATRPKSERKRWAYALSAKKSELATRAFLSLDGDSDPELRRLTVGYLSAHGDERALPILRTVLADNDRNHLWWAMTSLGRLRDAQSLPALAQRLSKFAAKDALTDLEIAAGKSASLIAGLKYDFSESCPNEPKAMSESLAFLRYKMELEKHPERAAAIYAMMDQDELNRKRRYCDNRGPARARKEFLERWESKGKNVYAKPKAG